MLVAEVPWNRLAAISRGFSYVLDEEVSRVLTCARLYLAFAQRERLLLPRIVR